MNPPNEAVSTLQQLAEKLGIPITQLWPEAVRYVVADAIAGLLFSIVMPLTVILLARWAWKQLEDAEETDKTMGRGSLAIVVLVVMVIGIHGIFTDVRTLLSPEGATVMRILGR